MSEENVDVVRACLEAFARGDYEASLAAFDPATTFDMSVYVSEVGHGPNGVSDVMRRWAGTFEEYGIEVGELRDVGDSVLVVTTQRGRGKGSGAEIEQTFHQVVTLRNRRIIHWQGFPTRRAALNAAGLSE